MAYRNITLIIDKHVASITLSRAEAGNTINADMAQEIQEACLHIMQDDSTYVVVLTAAGDTFCHGSELLSGDSLAAAAIAAIDRPMIAAINGDAIGAGLELALACDIRLASDGAKFSMPGVAGGKIPTGGGTQRLPRIVGKAKALELLLTAETINAAQALEIGLINQVIPAPELMNRAMALAGTMAGKGPVALRFIKEAVNKGLDLTLEQGLRLEGDLYFLLHTTADRTEGVTAFREKRTPQFKGK